MYETEIFHLICAFGMLHGGSLQIPSAQLHDVVCTITILFIHESDLKKCKRHSYIEGVYQWCLEEGKERVDDEYAVDGVANSHRVDAPGW